MSTVDDVPVAPDGRGPSRTAAFWRANRLPIVFFPTISLVLAVTQHVSNRVVRSDDYSFWPPLGLHEYFDGWQQFDGHSYLDIATNGYSYVPGQKSNIVWFPLYPNLIRIVQVVVTDPMIAGILITFVAGFVGSLLWWRWLGVKGMVGRTRTVAYLTMMLYPYAWYLYGPVHADAVFWALVIGACLLVESDRLVLAGLVGALATATRPSGMAVIPALVVLGFEHRHVLTVPAGAVGLVERYRIPVRLDRSRLGAVALAPATCVVGLGSFMVYQWARFGDPLAFVHNQTEYHPGSYPIFKRAFFAAWRDAGPDFRLPLTITAQALFALLVICTAPAVGRRFGWGYAVLVAVMVAIPTVSTEEFMGTGRYLIAAFPTAALAGEWLAERRRLHAAVLAVSSVAIVGLNMGFSRSWYLT